MQIYNTEENTASENSDVENNSSEEYTVEEKTDSDEYNAEEYALSLAGILNEQKITKKFFLKVYETIKTDGKIKLPEDLQERKVVDLLVGYSFLKTDENSMYRVNDELMPVLEALVDTFHITRRVSNRVISGE